MIELLRDSVWQSIGALLALLALPWAFWLYLLQRPRKELAYAVLSSRRLLAIASELRGRVQITVDEKPVEDVHLMVIGVKNSGNVPILQSDFVYPPRVRMLNHGRFISAEVSKLRPENLSVAVDFDSDHFSFAPLLLNPGDHFVIQALVSAQNAVFEPDFRIMGVSRIEKLSGSRPVSVRSDWGSFLFWFLFLALMIFAGTYMDTNLKKVVFIGVPTAIMLAVIYLWAKARYGPDASRYLVDA